MNKIIDSMLNGLSAQYAGEYMSLSNKDQILNNHPVTDRQVVTSPRARVILPNILKNEKSWKQKIHEQVQQDNSKHARKKRERQEYLKENS